MAAQNFRSCQGYSSVDFSDLLSVSYDLLGSYLPTSISLLNTPHVDPGGVRTHVGQMVNLQVAGF